MTPRWAALLSGAFRKRCHARARRVTDWGGGESEEMMWGVGLSHSVVVRILGLLRRRQLTNAMELGALPGCNIGRGLKLEPTQATICQSANRPLHAVTCGGRRGCMLRVVSALFLSPLALGYLHVTRTTQAGRGRQYTDATTPNGHQHQHAQLEDGPLQFRSIKFQS